MINLTDAPEYEVLDCHGLGLLCYKTRPTLFNFITPIGNIVFNVFTYTIKSDLIFNHAVMISGLPCKWDVMRIGILFYCPLKSSDD